MATKQEDNNSQRSSSDDDGFNLLDLVAARLSHSLTTEVGDGGDDHLPSATSRIEKGDTTTEEKGEIVDHHQQVVKEEDSSTDKQSAYNVSEDDGNVEPVKVAASRHQKDEAKNTTNLGVSNHSVGKGQMTNLESGVVYPFDTPMKASSSFESYAEGGKTSNTKDSSLQQQEAFAPSPTDEAERTSSHLIPGAFACSVSSNVAVESATTTSDAMIDSRTTDATTTTTTSSSIGMNSASTTMSVVVDMIAAEQGLAEAIPVSEPQNPRTILPQADAVDLEAQQEKEAARQDRADKSKQWASLAIGLIMLVVLIVGVSLGVHQKQNKSAPSSNTSSPSSTGSVPPLPVLSTKEHIKSLLPNGTLVAIDADPFSPQSLAFDFVKNDPKLDTYPDWRIQQRFALATVFYSTSGTKWKDNNGWMSYRKHECQWYACPYLHYNVDPEEEGLTPFYGTEYNNPCNNTDPTGVVEKEVFVKLWVWFHDLEGTIPPQVGLLTSLFSISMGYNPNITGTIPSQLGVLTNLELLDLAETSITGTIPTQLGYLSSLKSLHLMDTYLTGTVPDQLSDLYLNITGTNLIVP